MSTKDDYEKGYADGRKAANETPRVLDIIIGALIPGTLPSEKSTAYQEGYKQGNKDEKK